MTNIAIFVSGSGTNCENIIRYFADNNDINVALVLSNKADAYALVRAERLGVPTIVVNRESFNNQTYMMDLMQQYAIDFIVLAGFLMMVPPFLDRKSVV